MKSNFLLLATLLLATHLSFGQDSLMINEPQYTGRMLYVKNPVEGQALEQQKASGRVAGNASFYLTGLGKTKQTNKIKGAKSPVRIPETEKYQFIIRVTDNNIDPFQLINIFKLEQKIKKNPSKSYRFIKVSESGILSTTAMDIKRYQFEAERYGKYSFLITITEPFEKGEYAITLEGSRDLFNLFGID